MYVWYAADGIVSLTPPLPDISTVSATSLLQSLLPNLSPLPLSLKTFTHTHTHTYPYKSAGDVRGGVVTQNGGESKEGGAHPTRSFDTPHRVKRRAALVIRTWFRRLRMGVPMDRGRHVSTIARAFRRSVFRRRIAVLGQTYTLHVAAIRCVCVRGVCVCAHVRLHVVPV